MQPAQTLTGAVGLLNMEVVYGFHEKNIRLLDCPRRTHVFVAFEHFPALLVDQLVVGVCGVREPDENVTGPRHRSIPTSSHLPNRTRLNAYPNCAGTDAEPRRGLLRTGILTAGAHHDEPHFGLGTHLRRWRSHQPHHCKVAAGRGAPPPTPPRHRRKRHRAQIKSRVPECLRARSRAPR